MKEFVDLKIVELKLEMAKEVDKIEEYYYVLHGKVDVLVYAIVNIMESILKVALSNQSFASQESISKLISSIEANLKAEISPILKLVLLLPTNAPPTKQVSQGGEKGCGDNP
ncbi:unnamed protein product [Lactuca saligna]|uniref:Uncharacterized protein n=1 Tax=Lactuca saligna TaxID=75948 RepID=A0AA35YZG4_LACSI|nr:unnamed protein product [Lactuca saligna]